MTRQEGGASDSETGRSRHVTAKWIRGDYEGLVVRRVVCEACLSPMTAEEGTSLPDGGVWFWWRCESGHVTAALPAPPRKDV